MKSHLVEMPLQIPLLLLYGPGSSPDWGCVVFLGKALYSQTAFLDPGIIKW